MCEKNRSVQSLLFIMNYGFHISTKVFIMKTIKNIGNITLIANIFFYHLGEQIPATTKPATTPLGMQVK